MRSGCDTTTPRAPAMLVRHGIDRSQCAHERQYRSYWESGLMREIASSSCVVVRTSRCGRDNPGSTPDVDTFWFSGSYTTCRGYVNDLSMTCVQCCMHEVPRGFEPGSLDSESRVLTVTPRDQMSVSPACYHASGRMVLCSAGQSCSTGGGQVMNV